MNSNRSTEDNSGNISGGWYNTRRQYRSIAFGTWKVGGARDLSVKRDVFEVKGQSIRSLNTTDRNYSMATTNRFSMTKSINFGIPINYGNIFEIDTMIPVRHENTIRMNRYRREGTPGSKSVKISESDINNRKGNEVTNIRENTDVYKNQTLNRSYGSLSRRKKDRIETSVQRVHQRSRSVGNDNHISFSILPCKTNFNNMSSTRYNNHHGYDGDSIDNGSSGGGVSNGLLNPFKATKKFFKKIYYTATLPGRLHSKLLASNVVESNEIPTTSISSERPCIDASYSLELPDDDQDYQYDNYQYNQDIANQDATNSCIIANNDSDSAPSIMKLSMLTDDAMNDSGLSRSISSNESQKTSYGDFRSWNDVFNHLKREMAYMRQRDAQILADLQFVELELRNVKNHQTMIKSNYAIRNNNNNNNNNRISINNNNDGHIFDKRQIKLGDLVESIPL